MLMSRRRVQLLASFLLLAGSYSAMAREKPKPDSVVPFFHDEIAWSRVAGKNAITGNALLRTVGGDVKTCAGLPVQLMPVSAYGTDRMRMIYGSDTAGFNSARKPTVIAPARSDFSSFAKQVVCDSSGHFKFQGLADGEYYIIAEVTWGVPMQYFTRQEGGMLMRRVEVKGGEIKDLIMSL